MGRRELEADLLCAFELAFLKEHDSLTSEADRVVLRGPQGWRMLHLHQLCYVDWEPSIATEE
jgi:hypothetical protein